MKFTLAKVKKLIEKSLTMGPVGHSLLDSEYSWYAAKVGHNNPYYKLFYLIAQELKPDFVVELGSYRGLASGHFAVGNPAGMVATVDWHKDMPGQQSDKDATLTMSRMIPNLFYYNKCSIDTMPQYGYDCALDDIYAYKKPIDILFIDAWHSEEHVKREWELYSPLLADNALVICDDLFNNAGQFAGMEEWWDSFKYQKFLNNAVHPGIPMGFMHYKKTVSGTFTNKPPKAKRGKTVKK